MKEAMKEFKAYWYSTDFEEMSRKKLKSLIANIHPAVLAQLENKIDEAFEIKGENIHKFTKRIDKVHDNVVFFYMLPNYIAGKTYINNKEN